MSIRIDEQACVGCGRCIRVCPGSLLKLVPGEAGRVATIESPEDCWGCVSCVKECAFSAIHFYLAEDISGKDGPRTTMQVRAEGPLLHWDFSKDGALFRTITVDRRNSNDY